MKVIYHCFGGTHSSVLCAALHLGIISERRLPGYRELMNCPYYDKVPSSQAGNIFHMGRDNHNNDIYVLGCRGCGPIVEKTIREIGRLLGISPHALQMINTTPCLNSLLRIGGFLSRGLGFTVPGRILLYLGTLLAFPKFIALVAAVKSKLKSQQLRITELDRKGKDLG